MDSRPIPVTFPSASPTLLNRLGNGPAERGRGELYLPRDLSEPRPAVVIIEGLGGVKNARERSYGAFLADNGFVTLVVDTFGARGADRYSHPVRALLVTEAMMASDAYAALRFLSDHPSVRRDRIFAIGFSYGGMISMLLAYRQIAEALSQSGERFAGHVSFYGCSIPRLEDPSTTGAPGLVMLGECDRNVSVERSSVIVDDLRRGGSRIDFEVLPGVYHQWDSDDAEKRFVPFNLRNCKIRLDPRSEAFEERTGFRVRGMATRDVLLALSADPRGYHILRDEDAIRHSDSALLRFLGGGIPSGGDVERHIDNTASDEGPPERRPSPQADADEP